MQKISDRELKKWLKILGSYKIKELYCESKIYLSKAQLDYVIEYSEDK